MLQKLRDQTQSLFFKVLVGAAQVERVDRQIACLIGDHSLVVTESQDRIID